jgi:hypothetical protein
MTPHQLPWYPVDHGLSKLKKNPSLETDRFTSISSRTDGVSVSISMTSCSGAFIDWIANRNAESEMSVSTSQFGTTPNFSALTLHWVLLRRMTPGRFVAPGFAVHGVWTDKAPMPPHLS